MALETEELLQIQGEGHMILDKEQLEFIAGQPRVMKCYNYQREGHMILDKEQLEFIADPVIEEALFAQQKIPQNVAFQTKDLNAYDSDGDDLSSAKAVLMVNLSSCDSDVLSEVPYFDTYPNDIINQDVQEMAYSEQTHLAIFSDNEINSDSNIIPYSQYLCVIAKEHVVISMTDDEETLILEEESRSKMLVKQNDPISIEKKANIALIDYSKLNNLKEDFGKHFVTQQELSAEQAFWLKHSSISETPIKSHTPVRVEAPSELPKCSVDKNDFEIKIKQLQIDNDQLLNQIMSQEIMHIVVNSVDIHDVSKSCMDECNKCLVLETELFKKKDFIEKDVYDKHVKSYSILEKYCIYLELATQLNQEIF
nr:hypothetical protein [Tanacetum cinerariifolium]